MNKQIRWGIILQYFQMFLNIIIHIIYTPIMIRILGDNEYGIYNLVSSIISYLSLLSLGFGAGYVKFYSRYKKDNDELSIKKLNGLYLLVFTVMGIIALISGLIISFNCNIFFNKTYSSNDLKIAKTLMIYLSFNLALSFPSSLFVSYITSQERFIFQKLINLFSTILNPCLCIAILFLGYGSIGMVITTTIISLLINAFNLIYCLSKLKMRFSFRKINSTLLKEIAAFSIFIAINQIIDQINWQTDKIILGKMINGAAVAIYAVASTINSLYMGLSTAISGVFIPKVHQIVSNNSKNTNSELTSLFIKVGRLQFFVISLILTGFIFFGKFFIIKWAGSNYELSYYIILLLICPITIPLIQNIGIEVQRAKNQHKFRSIIYLFMAILNIFISIIFCKLLGTIGVAIGTTISLVVCNILIMNIYYHKAIKINVIKFWKSILSILPSYIPPVIFGVFIMAFYNFSGLFDYLFFVCLYTIIYCISVYFFGLNANEKEYIKAPIKKFLNNKEIKK